MREYDLRIIDSAIETGIDKPIVHFRPARPGRRALFKVTIRVAGLDLPYVADVEYQLSPSFKARVHWVSRTISNRDCALTIWTWSVFTVRATIILKSGYHILVDHRLRFGDEIRDYPPSELQWDPPLEWTQGTPRLRKSATSTSTPGADPT